jgi:HEAT repeat protein
VTIRATSKITLGEGIAAPWIGLAGAAALLIGVFLPLIRLPIFGSVNYIFNGQGDGMIVAVLALVAACTSLARWYRSLWIAGLLVLALMTFTFTRLQLAAPGDWAYFQLEWGWAVLAIGAITTVAAAVTGVARRNMSRSRATLTLGAASIILMIAATAVSTWGIPKIIVAQREAARATARAAAEESARATARQAREEADRREAARQAAEREAARQAAERETAKREALRDETRQTLLALEGVQPPRENPPATEWADAAAYKVRQGDLCVRVTGLSIDDGTLVIDLLIENLGHTNSIPVRPWGRITGPGEPVLLDPQRNQHPRMRAEAEEAVTLLPGQSIPDRLAFAGIRDVTEYVGLELHASAFNGYGKLRLRIPQTMIVLRTAAARGGAGLPGLVKLVSSPDPKIRADALTEIGRLRPPARGQLETVAARLADRDADVRRAAEAVLQAWEPYGREDVPRLKAALQQPDVEARLFAARALSQMGVQAAGAAAELVDALKDDSELVRQQAALALGKLAASGSEAVPALAKALDDNNSGVRQAAVRSLAALPAESGNLDALLRAVRNSDAAVAVTAAEAVNQHPRLGKRNGPSLVEALRRGPREIKTAMTAALQRLGPDVEGAVAAIADALQYPDTTIRKRAAQALGTFGMEARPAVPALAKKLFDPDADVRRTAATALGGIGPHAGAAAPDLITALKDDTVRADVEQALLKIGSSAAFSLATVVEKSTNVPTRLKAIELLERIGPGAKKVLPELRQVATSDPIPSIRRAAAKAVESLERQR